jgi:cytochrome c oxidase subunit IV
MATETSHPHYGESGSGHDEAHHHITPPIVYLRTFGILLVLMALTVWASYLNLGIMNNVIAMVIAIAKATLVVLFFMQVRYGTKLTWLWAGLGFVWFLLMFGILSDYISREWIPLHGWQQVNGPHQ